MNTRLLVVFFISFAGFLSCSDWDDLGPKACKTEKQCYPGESCINGRCAPGTSDEKKGADGGEKPGKESEPPEKTPRDITDAPTPEKERPAKEILPEEKPSTEKPPAEHPPERSQQCGQNIQVDPKPVPQACASKTPGSCTCQKALVDLNNHNFESTVFYPKKGVHWVFAGTWGGRVFGIDLKTGRRFLTIEGRHFARLTSIDISPNGKWLAVGAWLTGVHLYRLTETSCKERPLEARHIYTYKETFGKQASFNTVGKVRFFRDNTHLLLGFSGGVVTSLRLSEKKGEEPAKVVFRWELTPWGVRDIQFHPTQNAMAVAFSSGLIFMFSMKLFLGLETWDPKKNPKPFQTVAPFAVLQGGSYNPATSLAFEPGGKWMLSVGGKGAVKAWKLKVEKGVVGFDKLGSGGTNLQLYNHGKVLHRIRFAKTLPNNTGRFFLLSVEGTLLQLDVVFDESTANDKANTVLSEKKVMSDLSISHDFERLLMTNNSQGWTSILLKDFSKTTGSTRIKEVDAAHANAITSMRYTSDGKFLVTASKDGTSKVWDKKTGVYQRTIWGQPGEVLYMDLSLDSSFVASSSSKAYVQVKFLKDNANAFSFSCSHPAGGIAFRPYPSTLKEGRMLVLCANGLLSYSYDKNKEGKYLWTRKNINGVAGIGHYASLGWLKFLNSSKLLTATRTPAGALKSWTVTGTPSTTPKLTPLGSFSLGTTITAIAVHPNNTKPYCVVGGGTWNSPNFLKKLVILDYKTGKAAATTDLSDAKQVPSDAIVSSDAKTLYVSFFDGSVRVYPNYGKVDLKGSQLLLKQSSTVTRLLLSEKSLHIASKTGALGVWARCK